MTTLPPARPADWLAEADRSSAWSEVTALVLGMGASGFAAADALLEVGAQVVVIAEAGDSAERRQILEVLGASVREAAAQVIDDLAADLVIVPPEASPALVDAAIATGAPIWGDVELAWRLMHAERPAPWLGVTGVEGRAETADMLASILSSAGLRTVTVGDPERPVIEALNDPEPYDALVVNLTGERLHWLSSVTFHSAVVLNVDPADGGRGDHDLGVIYRGVTHACVYNVAELRTEHLVEEADVTDGARAIGFTLGTPAVSMVGLVEDLIVDRAFIPQRRDSALEVAKLHDVGPQDDPLRAACALAATALARSFGVPAKAVADGLRAVDSADTRPGSP